MEIEGCPLPDDRLYDLEQDVWIQNEPTAETARIGIISVLAAFIGRAQSVTFRPRDGPLSRGRSVGMLETIRFTGAVRMPVDGRVVATNEALRTRPRLVTDDPYGDGWVARVHPGAPLASAPWLEPAAAIRDRVRGRILHDRIRCWPASPDLEMFEIGVECSAILTKLNEEVAARPAGSVLLLVTDDPTSPIEMSRWADQTGHSELARRREGGLFQFLVRKEANPVPRIRRSR